ncbi:MAG: T9SS type A sorting domain-containing protein, partial [Crocinitomicaceae bacterium]
LATINNYRMKKLLLLIVLITSIYSYSQLNYNIVNGFWAPTGSAGDLTFDGENLWVSSLTENGNIYKISPLDGTVLKVINVNLTGIGGLTFGNGNLWAAESNSAYGKIILEVDTISGQTITTIHHDLGDFIHGMEFHNNNLYINMFYSGVTDTTVIMDQNGVVLNKYPLPYTHSHGIAYDGCSFWITTNNAGGTSASIHEIDETTFGELNLEGIPGGNYPNGLAWDGNYLWIANTYSDSIFQIDLSICPILGNAEIASEEKINLHPNPVPNQLYIKDNQFGLSEVKIFNSAGILIKESNTDFYQVDMSDLTPGLYFIGLVGDEGTVTKKI